MAFYFCRVLPQPILNNKEECDRTRGLKYCFQISFSCLIKNENLFKHGRIVITLKEDFTYYCQHIEGQQRNSHHYVFFSLYHNNIASINNRYLKQLLLHSLFFVCLFSCSNICTHARTQTHTLMYAEAPKFSCMPLVGQHTPPTPTAIIMVIGDQLSPSSLVFAQTEFPFGLVHPFLSLCKFVD